MRIITKGRQRGKTTQLIYTSEATGATIVVSTIQEKENIKRRAKEMYCNIPEPVTVKELEAGKRQGRNYDFVMVDNMEKFLKDALESYLGAKVLCGTLTVPNIIEPKPAEMYKHNKEGINRLVDCVYRCMIKGNCDVRCPLFEESNCTETLFDELKVAMGCNENN